MIALLSAMSPELVTSWNLLAAWIGILAGMSTGAIVGLFFDREHFAGGYGSWRRRLMRLGHISFFGLAIINFMFYVTVSSDHVEGALPGASMSLIAGAVTMPAVCYLSAWRPACRHAFFIPVGCLLIGVVLTLKHLIGAL